MSKIDDIELFVRVVRAGGLAAAGREVGLSPASMTARMNALEARYQTRLLQRSTRSIALTEAGARFYEAGQRVVTEMAQAEAALLEKEGELRGSLRVTATSDFGRQYVAPALAQFVSLHPLVRPALHLHDGVVNLIEESFDLAIRYGNLPNSNLIVRPLMADNRRVLCASPAYVASFGQPQTPEDLLGHRCLVMTRFGEMLAEWRFQSDSDWRTLTVEALLASNDGAQIRQWALAGLGIALKSWCDVSRDITEGRLLQLLPDQIVGLHGADAGAVGLQMIYPSRKYTPACVKAFMDHLGGVRKQRSRPVRPAYRLAAGDRA
ncbi:LysR family transcriptional regulator [Hahella sp. HN01]|uniref:LysR family transcriptional regulator n=1 Tax=Hahella sp. HN01 TaxID=2847262 RepID=UPI001C1EBE7E|nr:LysR family transcriptional regulator [Hahella sp. HN01]MBU6953053.1 LysR family transcriptional regulator [Hahella sp. HN01]